MADYFLYILECADRTYYVGTTTNVEARERRHQEGRGCEYTCKRRPVRLVYQERHPTLPSAGARERQLKRWTHAKKKALIAGDRTSLRRMSAGRHSRPQGSTSAPTACGAPPRSTNPR
jgi:predicted GIY-YIG superfamily endonuclease